MGHEEAHVIPAHRPEARETDAQVTLPGWLPGGRHPGLIALEGCATALDGPAASAPIVPPPAIAVSTGNRRVTRSMARRTASMTDAWSVSPRPGYMGRARVSAAAR